MEYQFSSSELESKVSELKKLGVTELSVHDEKFKSDKRKIISLLKLVGQKYPELFVSFLTDAKVIDRELLSAASEIFCSLEIPLEVSEKGGKILFDKKFYSAKARLLNEWELTFGFQLLYSVCAGDSLKNFFDRLDFAVQQYPNHIDFPQTEADLDNPMVTGQFSARDLRYARDVAFACRTFYSAGRAVPWFLSVLKPLKIYPSRFFADFAEWQRCNNCDFKSGFCPEKENHKAIEKMQLLFLEEKYEEKGRGELFALVKDIVRLNGALSRLMAEGEDCVVETSYNSDDLLGPESLELEHFSENVCMESCQTSLKIENGEPSVRIL